MPLFTQSYDGTISRTGGATTSYSRFDLAWSGLPADVTITRCYWKWDVSRSGSTYARWYIGNYSGHAGVSGTFEFDVALVSGTSGTAQVWLGAQNGTARFTNVSFNIEYAYKQSSLTLSASSVEAGKAITATIAAQSSTATHKLVWALGSNSQTQNLAAGVTSSAFTVPLAWLPSATSGVATCTLTTLQDGVQVGETQTLSFTVTVNAAVIPSCTVKAELVNGFSGLYLGGRSSVKLTIQNAKAGDGSSIKSYKLSGGGYSSTAQMATFGPLNAGAHTFTATVTDSRGRTGTATVSVTVQAYSAPTLSGISIYRSDSGGTASESGGCIALQATAAYTALSGSNALTLQGRYRPVGGAWSAWTTMTSGNRLLLGEGALSATASYEAQIQATDTVGNTASYAAIIPTASVTFNLKAGGKGAAFGKYAEGNGLELAADWGFHRDGRSLTPAPRNLLGNSDFSNPVAQAGLNGLHGTQKYVCDRWISWGADAVFENGCMTTGSPYDQRVSRTIIDLAKTYTAAICLADGTIKAASGTFAAGFGSYPLGIYCMKADEALGYVIVRLNTGNSYRWAALYEGSYTADTLPEYVPKGYAAELAECIRYYRIGAETRWTDRSEANGGIAVCDRFQFPMRTTPTITGTMQYRAAGTNDGFATASNMGTSTLTPNGFRGYFVMPAANADYLIQFSYIASADL